MPAAVAAACRRFRVSAARRTSAVSSPGVRVSASATTAKVRTDVPRLTAPSSWPGRRHARLVRSEEHTSELQSHVNLVCRLLLEKKKQDDHLEPKGSAAHCDQTLKPEQQHRRD